ncbi:STE20-related kinase adapter protein alpha [Cylas formicarius]|uniref:STE20-related kinase adapter protein alpha n=1 Tax=Cylas formicarius TaxID=197179 RepID=UPI002958875A|nr:STE20-related kinase adapter protein alpha [Cylas formicarius]
MVQYNANLSEYKIITILGQCFDGRAAVHLAKHLPTGQMVAVKKINMDKIKCDASLVEVEIVLTKQLQHQNIITYHISFISGQDLCIVSPLFSYGSCRDLINQHFNEGLPEQAIITILRDLLDALNYLHRKGFIHRAIRASHILVSSSGKACLAGLRYSCPLINNGRWQKTIHSFPSNTEKNLNWLSPELLEQNLVGYNEKSDLYSVGMVICELANGCEPFAGMPKTLMLTEKVRGCTPQLLDCSTVPRDENGDCSGGDCDISPKIVNRRFSDDLHEMAALCLNRDPFERPSASQLLSHPIFKTIKKSLPLRDLLKPALPLSDKVAFNSDDVEDLDTDFSQLEIYSCEWDFE